MYAEENAGSLPLFPLGAVAFPGLTLPLHVFEERYRHLLADLLELPADEPRRFGIVSIALGHEVGESSAHQLADVGCVATIRTIERHDDGRYDLVVEGQERFRIEEFHDPDDHPYLRATITPLPDEAGPDAESDVERVSRHFTRYGERLREVGVPAELPDELPTDPVRLSYTVASAMIIDQSEKQRLLEAEHAADRLELAIRLLRRENRVLAALPTLPAGPFLRHEINLN